MIDDRWVIIDRRTGRRVTMAVWNRRIGNLTVLGFRDRQRRGGRADISFEQCQAVSLVPHAQQREDDALHG